ncbi:MAG TPA: LytTR family DNA-binding domain-containing protein [Usitatibacter sp.]|nr:LytTR family DNA-binding domain-containing protein [Usitatibacter sp.]
MSDSVRVRAIIAEDEPGLAQELREQLQLVWPELDVRAVAPNGIEALRSIEEHRPDVAFLDVNMPGATGLEVARQASGRVHVVFVTAFDHYAVDAFEQGAVDYIRKPFTAARLFNTVKRVRERMALPPRDLGPLLRGLAGAEAARSYLRWINTSKGDEIVLITTEEVVYFKAEDKYTVVVTAAGESLIRRPLKDLVAELDPESFWQIHRSTVVNANAIAGVRRDLRGRLEVRLKSRDETLPVGESYNRRFKQM